MYMRIRMYLCYMVVEVKFPIILRLDLDIRFCGCFHSTIPFEQDCGIVELQ